MSWSPGDVETRVPAQQRQRRPYRARVRPASQRPISRGDDGGASSSSWGRSQGW
jgi:hypothetical protein